ncbi:MAG TPA: hypothetical protein PLI53_09975 [Geobacteraceae bacterium]|nr:hypothetical protein [Geobacteraceae bacterium]
MKSRLKYGFLILPLLALFAVNDFGLARGTVHSHFINPQNKVYNQPVSGVKKIKWAYRQDERIYVCIHGVISENRAPNGGYTTVSTFPTGRYLPELIESDTTFLAFFSKQLLTREKWQAGGSAIVISAASISPDCDERSSVNQLPVFEVVGSLKSWLEQNHQETDFLFNQYSPPRAGFSNAVESRYALVKGGLEALRFDLKIDTSIQRSEYDLLIGVVLYPAAILIDIVTSPLQFILLHLGWG